MVEKQKAEKNPALILALKDLKMLHEKSEKNLLTGGEIIRIKDDYKSINEFINEIEKKHRELTHDGISDSKTLKDLNITLQIIDQYVVPNRRSNEAQVKPLPIVSNSLKVLKDRKKELNTYLKKNKKNRHEVTFAESVHELIEIRKEIKIKEESRNEVKQAIGIEPEKFYRKYNLSLLEKQEKKHLQEKIKNNSRELMKKDTISLAEINAFHNDLCSYIDKSKLNSQKSFYDMRTSKTAAKNGIHVINDDRKKETETLSAYLAYLTDKELQERKAKLNSFLKNNSNDVKDSGFNNTLNEIAVYKEEFEIRKCLAQLDKIAGTDVKKIYSKSNAVSGTRVNNYRSKWNELRDKFRAADSPHILKHSNITKEENVEQRTLTVDSNRESDPNYEAVVSRKAPSIPAIPQSNVSMSNDVIDSPYIPVPPPLPGEKSSMSKSVPEYIERRTPVIESDYAEVSKVVSEKQHTEKTEAIKEEPIYAEINEANKKENRIHAAKNQAVLRNTNLETVNTGFNMDELRNVLVARRLKMQAEENKHDQLIQTPETKHSITDLTDTHYNKLFEITEQNSSFRRNIVKKRSVSNESINQEYKKTIETVRNHAEAKAKRQILSKERNHYSTIRTEKESFA